jgi:tetratricopeptide (TPR) repeat protein
VSFSLPERVSIEIVFSRPIAPLFSKRLFPSSLSPAIQTSSIEDYLSMCEQNIFACWRLMRGKEIAVVQSVLCTWLPPLEDIIRQSIAYQKRSASLAAQGYIIAGLVTVLRRDYDAAEWCCKQAIAYSDLAEDYNLKVAALKHLATKYNSAKYPLKTLHTYQEALLSVEQVSPLLRSRIYLGLALSYAQCGERREAFQYWDLTQQSFPAQPENDPSFIYADCGKSSLNHYGGLMYLAFGQAKKAWEIFEEVVQMQQEVSIPERTIIEIVNCKAEAAIVQKNLDLACAHLREGVQGAIRLQSEKRFHDSLSLYKQARAFWPEERSLLELEELFH